MKILKIGGLMLLAAATVFFGFHFFFGQDEVKGTTGDVGEGTNTYLEEIAYYRELTAQLETELSVLKQEQYTAAKQYENRITELELLLKESEADAESEQPELPQATFTYTVSDDQITITGYSGRETNLSIPASIDGFDVVAIGRDAFRESALTEVIIPSTVQKIDWFAFYASNNLTRVAIPSSITKIEYGVFDGCDNLTVYCEKNSYADKYARSYGMSVSN